MCIDTRLNPLVPNGLSNIALWTCLRMLAGYSAGFRFNGKVLEFPGKMGGYCIIIRPSDAPHSFLLVYATLVKTIYIYP